MLVVRRHPTSYNTTTQAQDLDECQIDFFAQQARRYGTHVFFVGDAAQTIYTFRGAKARNLLLLRSSGGARSGAVGLADRDLTTSWRFGARIGAAANTLLFGKARSPQTAFEADGRTLDGWRSSWAPYRLVGGAAAPGVVARRGLLTDRARWPIAVVGRSNAGLLSVRNSDVSLC